jgi:hypothetical protein
MKKEISQISSDQLLKWLPARLPYCCFGWAILAIIGNRLKVKKEYILVNGYCEKYNAQIDPK